MSWAAILVCSVVLNACALNEHPAAVQPVSEVLPLDVSVEPGLPIYFRYSFYRNIDQMPKDASMISEGRAGRPVAFLDHRFQGSIFDSGAEKGVGVFLTGYLKMEKAGRYLFKAMSNDGIRVLVNGEVVVLDPTVHSDRFSPVGEIRVDKPGWYPLTVKYFQRKGTARIELYWQPPEVDAFELVPAAAYGHLDDLK